MKNKKKKKIVFKNLFVIKEIKAHKMNKYRINRIQLKFCINLKITLIVLNNIIV